MVGMKIPLKRFAAMTAVSFCSKIEIDPLIFGRAPLYFHVVDDLFFLFRNADLCCFGNLASLLWNLHEEIFSLQFGAFDDAPDQIQGGVLGAILDTRNCCLGNAREFRECINADAHFDPITLHRVKAAHFCLVTTQETCESRPFL